MNRPVRFAVLASGGGTNLQALIDYAADRTGWSVALVLSDRPDAGALVRAERAEIPTDLVPLVGRAVDAERLCALLREREIDGLLLAGFLRLVPPMVVREFDGRIVNIHPALLPAFGGKGMYGSRIHRAVLESGVEVTGVTVHLVDDEYDRGTIVAQVEVPVQGDDTPESLARRVLGVEHRLFPVVADRLAESIAEGGRLEPYSEPPFEWTPDPASTD